MNLTIIFVYILALFSAFVGLLVMRAVDMFGLRLGFRERESGLLMTYSKLTKKDITFMNEDEKLKLNNRVAYIYYTFWGLLIPPMIIFWVPDNIQSLSSGEAFGYLTLIVLSFFLVVHSIYLGIVSFYSMKENPFWKWGMRINLLSAFSRLVYSIAAVSVYLSLNLVYVYVFV